MERNRRDAVFRSVQHNGPCQVPRFSGEQGIGRCVDGVGRTGQRTGFNIANILAHFGRGHHGKVGRRIHEFRGCGCSDNSRCANTRQQGAPF